MQQEVSSKAPNVPEILQQGRHGMERMQTH